MRAGRVHRNLTCRIGKDKCDLVTLTAVAQDASRLAENNCCGATNDRIANFALISKYLQIIDVCVLPRPPDRVKAFFVAAPQIARKSTTHRPATSQTLRELSATNACACVGLTRFGIAGI
jgi:hypothetical protein